MNPEAEKIDRARDKAAMLADFERGKGLIASIVEQNNYDCIHPF